MEEDFEGGGVGSQDDELRDSTVQGLGGLVRSLLKLLVVGRLLHKVEESHGELGLGEGISFGFVGHDGELGELRLERREENVLVNITQQHSLRRYCLGGIIRGSGQEATVTGRQEIERFWEPIGIAISEVVLKVVGVHNVHRESWFDCDASCKLPHIFQICGVFCLSACSNACLKKIFFCCVFEIVYCS